MTGPGADRRILAPVFTVVRPATAADVAEFVEWRYEPPYDVYDLTDPLDEAIPYFTAPATRCHVVETGDGIAGYCTFGADARVPGGDYSITALDIGAALRPDLTGRGNGRAFVATIVAFANRAFDPDRLRVSIADENDRAKRAWAGNGFVETQRFTAEREILGSRDFVIMEQPVVAGGVGR